jgi:hypothetical protein
MPKAKEQTEELATTKVANPGALAVSDDLMSQLLEDQGAGTMGMGKEDVAIPRLAILQQLSPMCTRGNAAYNDQAKSGDIYNSVMDKLYDGEKGIEIILCAYQRNYIQWRLRTKGGGFIKDWGHDGKCLEVTTPDSFGANIVNDDPESEIVATAEYFGMIVNPDGSVEYVIIDLAKSQMKHARFLNAKIQSYTPSVKKPDGTMVRIKAPMFYRSYMFKTQVETNKKQQSWMGWDITPGRELLGIEGYGEELYTSAREFRKQVESGAVKAAPPADGGQAGDGDESGDGKVPF